jgi:hypothetical protein
MASFPLLEPSFINRLKKDVFPMKRWILVCLLAASLCACSGPALALTVSVTPDHIRSGDRVSVNVEALPENAHFSLLLDSSFKVEPGAEFSFEARQFDVPFSLTGGTVTAVMENTTSNRLYVKKDDSVVTLSGSSKNGQFRTTSSYEISSGVYDIIALGGRASNTTGTVNARLELTGAKKGPNSGGISFNVEGITDGVIHVTALVDGKQVLYQPVQVETTVPGMESTKSQESGTRTAPPDSGGDDYGGNSPAVPAGTPESIVPGTPGQKPVETTISSQIVAPIVTFSSIDGFVSGSAGGPAYIGIVRADPSGIPGGWNTIRAAYVLSPENTTFSVPGTIRFTVPQGTRGNASLTIARQEPGGWEPVPSGYENGSVTGIIAGTGTYGLFELPQPPTTVPTTPATTTKVPVTTRKSPVSPAIPMMAFAGASLVASMLRFSHKE